MTCVISSTRLIAALILALRLTGSAAAEAPLLSAATDPAQWRARIGQPVYTADGAATGMLVSLIADRGSGRPIGAVVRRFGLFGLWSQDTIVPADQVATVNTDVVVLRWTTADLNAAPPAETLTPTEQVVEVR